MCVCFTPVLFSARCMQLVANVPCMLRVLPSVCSHVLEQACDATLEERASLVYILVYQSLSWLDWNQIVNCAPAM